MMGVCDGVVWWDGELVSGRGRGCGRRGGSLGRGNAERNEMEEKVVNVCENQV